VTGWAGLGWAGGPLCADGGRLEKMLPLQSAAPAEKAQGRLELLCILVALSVEGAAGLSGSHVLIVLASCTGMGLACQDVVHFRRHFPCPTIKDREAGPFCRASSALRC